MTSNTEKNLAYAFAAESRAYIRNEAFAKKAEMEKHPHIARLFRAVADSEAVHAKKYLLLMRGKIGSTKENLNISFENEIKANVDEYPNLIRDAVNDGEKGVEKAFSQSLEVEKHHADLYKKAITDMAIVEDIDYYVCQICGFIAENEAPENCPVCNAVRTRFNKVP